MELTKREFVGFCGILGGSAWESNPPERLLTPHTGFEVRESHQCPIHFLVRYVSKIGPILIGVDLENNSLL